MRAGTWPGATSPTRPPGARRNAEETPVVPDHEVDLARGGEVACRESARGERHGAPPGSVQQESDGRVGQLLDIGLREESGLSVPDDLVDARGADPDGPQTRGTR